MDYPAYRRAYFTETEPRFAEGAVSGATLYYADFDAAVAFYTEALGPPQYSEGAGTRGWRIGDSWLTLLSGGDGVPTNVEVGFSMPTVTEAERLVEAFLGAGATGTGMRDELMYVPVRAGSLRDPFGVAILVFTPL